MLTVLGGDSSGRRLRMCLKSIPRFYSYIVDELDRTVRRVFVDSSSTTSEVIVTEGVRVLVLFKVLLMQDWALLPRKCQ